uniref:protein ANKUB1-like n=1 Tax=Centroberyx gerrardi TaxID=166262 RepID=UPI003AAA5399
MRVFICFEGSWEPFDVPPDQTVGAMKQMVKDYFHVQLSDDKQVHHCLELSYAGAALQDGWALCDVGIAPGSAIPCLIKNVQKPVMHVFNAVTRETLPIMGSVFLLSASVARLKTMVSLQCGLPVSSFRLSTPSGVTLYDCNQLHDYAIEVGTTLRLDTWDGWVEFLHGCFLGHRLTVQSHLSEEKPLMRFQLRVALYLAAFLGHLDLADWLLERGVHAEEPVGVHPYRLWCHQTAHPDAGKCPIHVAAENGQLLILKLFITKNLLALACWDPGGRDPLRIAVQHGHRECVRYLATKLCSVVSLPNISLPMRTYLQVKHWVRLGQRRAGSRRCSRAPFRSRVGDTVLVDGFTQPKMTSKSRRDETKSNRRIRAKALRPLPSISRSPWVSHLPSKSPSQQASLQLPGLCSANSGDSKETWKKQKHGGNSREDGLQGETKHEDSSQWRSRVPLPPIPRETNHRPLFVNASPNSSHILTSSLESFSRRCGRTPRENAIYCLAMASTFTERPWLKQLDIARTLVRKSIQTVT